MSMNVCIAQNTKLIAPQDFFPLSDIKCHNKNVSSHILTFNNILLI